MLRVWMEKESSLGVLGLQKSKSTESSPPPPPQPRTPKIFRKWLKLHARVRAALQLLLSDCAVGVVNKPHHLQIQPYVHTK